MKTRYCGLVLSIVMLAGTSAVCAWFWMESMGRSFALGMVPFVLAGAWLTVYWLHRIVVTYHVLAPGKCECGHIRSCHVGGRSECNISYGISDKFPKGSSCACTIFIPEHGSSRDDSEVSQLKKMAGLN